MKCMSTMIRGQHSKYKVRFYFIVAIHLRKETVNKAPHIEYVITGNNASILSRIQEES